MERKYDLVGVDGNAFSVVGYTQRALRETGHKDQIKDLKARAFSGDYNQLICVCLAYIDLANGDITVDELADHLPNNSNEHEL